MTTPAGVALSYRRVFVCATTSSVYEFPGRCTRACLQTHHGPAPLLDPALSESRVRATLQTRPSPIRSGVFAFARFAVGRWPPAFCATTDDPGNPARLRRAALRR